MGDWWVHISLWLLALVINNWIGCIPKNKTNTKFDFFTTPHPTSYAPKPKKTKKKSDGGGAAAPVLEEAAAAEPTQEPTRPLYSFSHVLNRDYDWEEWYNTLRRLRQLFIVFIIYFSNHARGIFPHSWWNICHLWWMPRPRWCVHRRRHPWKATYSIL